MKIHSPGVAIESTVKSFPAPDIGMPSQIEVKEDARRINHSVCPSAVRRADADIARPWGINHEIVEYFHVGVHVKIDPHHLVGSVAFDMKFRMALANIVSQFKDGAKTLVSFVGQPIQVLIQFL